MCEYGILVNATLLRQDLRQQMYFHIRVEPLSENDWDLLLIPVDHYIGWHVKVKNLESAKRWAATHAGASLLDGAWRVDPNDITIMRCRMLHGGFLIIKLERYPNESTQVSTKQPITNGYTTAQSQYCLMALQLRLERYSIRPNISNRNPRRRSRD
jgi:hypothetical protein